MAVQDTPAARPRPSAPALVTMAQSLRPEAVSISTSVFTAPLFTWATVPSNWLRVESRCLSASVISTTWLALIMAMQSLPGARPSFFVLLLVTMATIRWPPHSMTISSLMAPGRISTILPGKTLRALVFMAMLLRRCSGAAECRFPPC